MLSRLRCVAWKDACQRSNKIQRHRGITSTIFHNYATSAPIMKPIQKLLIANRGEIACRIMRTTKRLGMKSVAVYSDPDHNQMHVKLADEAYNIGPAASQLSYLDMNKIIEVAKSTGCQAIHPGYGFLSENVEFAELCAKEGIIFVGPPSNAIRDMGIKSTSKKIMSEAKVPIIEGYHGEDQSDEKLLDEAFKVGFPIMIKAVRGGGGKGMRIAMTEEEFSQQLDAARREAMASFGDDGMLIEKYIDQPRHVEVQVFGDHHGNAVHLYERDCSVQRRHQKIIEEAPAPGISHETRISLGEAAVRAALAVGYVGAGTVEFVMDPQQNFYFMEMNTRLQVEHPITEMVTGTDLVEWQLHVAQGNHLPVSQDQINLNGHSFEARIYAEDPDNGFMPGAGPLLHLRTPTPGTDLRVETGVRQGDDVSSHYDPMIAKLVVWDQDRSRALSKLHTALGLYEIVGPDTNISFLRRLASNQHFQDAEVHTGFIPEHFDALFPEKQTPSSSETCLLALIHLLTDKHRRLSEQPTNKIDPYLACDNFQINLSPPKQLAFNVDGCDVTVEVRQSAQALDGSLQFEMSCGDDGAHQVTGVISADGEVTSTIDGVVTSHRVVFVAGNRKMREPDSLRVFSDALPGGTAKITLPLAQHLVTSSVKGASGGGSAQPVAPMTGAVEKIFVAPGDEVKEGEPLVVMLAMKMEHTIRSPRDGVVESVFFGEGESAERNVLLVKLKEEAAE